MVSLNFFFFFLFYFALAAFIVLLDQSHIGFCDCRHNRNFTLILLLHYFFPFLIVYLLCFFEETTLFIGVSEYTQLQTFFFLQCGVFESQGYPFFFLFFFYLFRFFPFRAKGISLNIHCNKKVVVLIVWFLGPCMCWLKQFKYFISIGF